MRGKLCDHSAVGGIDSNCQQFNIASSPSDTNLYFNVPTGKAMHFQVANATKMLMDSSGNVGIGTTAPGRRLSIRGVAADSSAIGFENSSATELGVLGLSLGNNNIVTGTVSGDIGFRTGGGNFLFSTNDGSTAHMVIKATTGNVGIGTTNPRNTLQLGDLNTSSTASNGQLVLAKSGASGGNRAFRMGLDSNYNLSIGDNGNSSDTSYTPYLTINYANGNATAGNVGIGTSSPSHKFTLYDASTYARMAIVSSASSGDHADLTFTNRAGSAIMGLNGDNGWGLTNSVDGAFFLNNRTGQPIHLSADTSSDATAGLTILESGNVGIGTTTVSNSGGWNKILQVAHTTNAALSVGNASRQYDIGVSDSTFYMAYDATAAAHRMVVNSSGNVGIGIESPTALLDVSAAAASSDILRVRAGGAGISIGTNASGFGLIGNTAFGSVITIDTSGNVGIGTTPAANNRLDVSGGMIRVVPTYGTPTAAYSTFLKLGYDTSDDYTYTVRRSGNTGFLEFVGAQTGYVGYTFNGKVGIGTESPTAQLHIQTDTAWSGGWRDNLKLTSTVYPSLRLHSLTSNKTSMVGNNDDGGLWFGVNGSGDTIGTYGMVITAARNVAVGTASLTPNTRLDVFAADGTRGGEFIRGSGVNAGAAEHYAGLGVDINGNLWGASLYQDGAQKFTVESNYGLLVGSGYQVRDAPANGAIIEGSVGIGTTVPRGMLDIVSGTNNTNGDGPGELMVIGTDYGLTEGKANIQAGSNTAQGANLGGGIAFGGRYIDATTVQANFAVIKAGKSNSVSGETGGYLAFGTRLHGSNMAERMRITDAGNVGIGTTAPMRDFTIVSTDAVVARIESDNINETRVELINTSTGGRVWSLLTGGSESNTGKLSIADSTAGLHRLQIDASGYVSILQRLAIGASDPSVALDVTGDIEYTGTIADVSDERLKENFTDYEGALNVVNSVNVKKYNMRSSPDRRETGFTAQNVQQFFPEAVSVVDPENGYLGVSYVAFVPVLARAVQELDAKFSVPRGATTTSAVLTADGKEVDLYALAMYSVSGLQEVSEQLAAFETRLASLEARIAALESGAFATDSSFLPGMRDWLATTTNGITEFFAKRVHTEELCVSDTTGETCITKAELDAILEGRIPEPRPDDSDENEEGSGEPVEPTPPVAEEPEDAADVPPAPEVSREENSEEEISASTSDPLEEAEAPAEEPEAPAIEEPAAEPVEAPAPSAEPTSV